MNRQLHFVFIAVGSRGDVQPFIALGLGLQSAGHRVQIAAFEQFGDLVRAHGVEFVSLGALPLRFTRQTRIKINFTGILGRILFWLLCRRITSGYLDHFVEVCAGADVLVYSRLAFPVYHLAEKWQIPCFYATPVPHTPTEAFVDPLFANSWVARFPVSRRFSFWLEEQLTLQSTAGAIQRWRRSLQLPALSRFELARHRKNWTTATLYGYSAHLLPRPASWADNIDVTGFWLLQQPAGWQPEAALVQFLAAGPAPVYIGFGSMDVPDREVTLQLFARALAATGQRGILATGQSAVPAILQAQSHVFCIQDVPQDWLFPRMRAVIHHGGAGTVAATLRAGVPSLIIPLNYDQPFWGRCLAVHGVSINPIPMATLTFEKLVAALQELTGNETLRTSARQMQQKLAGENGVQRAVDGILERIPNRLT